MKKLDEKYWKIVKYVVLGVSLSFTAVIGLIFVFKMVFDIPNTLSSISGAFGLTLKILGPFVVGLVFAYLFDPVVEFLQGKYEAFEDKNFKERKEKRLKKLEEKGDVSPYKKRMAGTTMLYLILIAILTILVMVVLNTIGGSKPNDNIPLSTQLINTVASTATYVSNMNESIREKLIQMGVSDYFLTIVDTVFDWMKGFTASIVTFIIDVAQGVFTGFLGLVMGFYLLVDKDAMKKKTIHIMNVFIPDEVNKKIVGFFTQLHNVFSGYIRGQLMDAAIYGTLVSIVLALLGMPYAFFIGLVSGFCNLIPYVGAFVAFTLSITIGLFSGNPMLAVYSAGAIFALQQIDSIYIYPKCVSSNIDISPLLVILALTVGGSLFGVVGMLFAVPITSLVKLLLGQFIDAQENSGKIKNLLSKKDKE